MKVFVTSGGSGARAGFGSGGLDASRGVIASHFVPVLERFGKVQRLDGVADAIRRARRQGAQGLHFCLAFPHELPSEAGAETVPVFGLGVEECPVSFAEGDLGALWHSRLTRSFGAVVLSSHAAAAVRGLMGSAYPVLVAPPPMHCPNHPTPRAAVTLRVTGHVLDTRCWVETGPPEILPTGRSSDADLDGEEASQIGAGASDGWPSQNAGPAWRKTPRYRLGVTRLHLVAMYREAYRDLLPAPAARIASRVGRTAIRAARSLGSNRNPADAPAALLAGDPAVLPPPGSGGVTQTWQDGSVKVAMDGLVFAAVQGAWDRSWADILSAFVTACRHDASATLAIKTVGLEPDARAGLAGYLRRLGPFGCRVVIIDGTVDGGLDGLVAAASFYLCASQAEASPLPMMRFLAAGRPAIAPAHSALADFVTRETSFVVASGREYETWPGDVEERLGATGWRLEWDSLCDCITRARALARSPDGYSAMAEAMSTRMQAFCSEDAVAAALACLVKAGSRVGRASFGRTG